MKESISNLRQKCQATHPNWNDQPWINLRVRDISIYFTWLFLQTSIKPNTITLISFLFGISTVIFLAYSQLIAAFISLIFTLVLDFTDGEVSRYRDQKSLEGIFLDKVYVFLVHPMIFFGLTLLEFQREPSIYILIAGFICSISVICYSVIVDYGRSIVIFDEVQKLVLSNRLKNFIEIDRNIDRDIQDEENGISKRGLNNLKNWAKSLFNLLDFPSIFILSGFVILLEILFTYFDYNTYFLSPSRFFLYLLAIIYPLVNIVFMLKNLYSSRIEIETNEFLKKLSQAIKS